MTKVLIALDESDESLAAARAAARLFAGAEFVAVNVARLQTPWAMLGPFGAVAVPDSAWWESVHEMTDEEIEEIAARAGVDAEPLAEAGDPAERICAAADEHDADVIVVGSHHRNMLARLFDPSVSEDVLRMANRPVLVVGRR